MKKIKDILDNIYISKIIDINKILIVVLILFIIIFSIQHNVKIEAGDDVVYKEAFHDIDSALEFSNSFLTKWGGRILIHLLLGVVLNQNIVVFKILNTLCILALVYIIVKIAKLLYSNVDKKEENKMIIFTTSLFVLLPIAVMSSSVFWISGAFNYLWPTLALGICLIPFIKVLMDKEIKPYEYIIYILAVLLAASAEQTGAILICFGVIIIAIKKFKVKKSLLIYYAFVLLLTVILLTVPGNKARLYAESLKYIPDFDMYSTFDKVFQGVVHTLRGLFIKENIIIIILFLLVGLNIYNKYKKVDKKTTEERQNTEKTIGYMKCIGIIPFIYVILLKLLNSLVAKGFDYESALHGPLYNFNYYGEEILTNFYELIPIIIGVFILVLIAILIYKCFEDKKKSIVYTLLYLAGIASSIVIGFSPTIYASGDRVYFVMNIMNIFVSVGLFTEMINKKEETKKVNLLYYGGIILAVIIVTLYVKMNIPLIYVG